MTNPRPDNSELEPDEDRPLDELRGFELPVSDKLGNRVTASIHRRQTVSHFATLSWNGFGAVLFELLQVGLSRHRPPSSSTPKDPS